MALVRQLVLRLRAAWRLPPPHPWTDLAPRSRAESPLFLLVAVTLLLALPS